MSLRARLVIGVIAVSAIGLAVADVTTYASLRSFLLDRTDSALDARHTVMERFGPPGDDRSPTPSGYRQHRDEAIAAPDGTPTTSAPLERPPGGTFRDFFQIRGADGTTVVRTVLPERLPGESRAPAPDLPRTISVPAGAANSDGERAIYFTVPASSGGDRYRVRASFEPGWTQMLIVATSLADVDSTLHRLLLIEVIVTLSVLIALGALGMWVVRLGLRPLEGIEQTAGAIAAGDLSQRVEPANERTEVGRLGLALNTMLGQIETAFKAREASERRLRRFVADASHELRTPLAAVRAYAELFSRGADTRPDDLARTMDGISRESERMSVLVDDLLLLARLDEGRPLEREPVGLAEIVREAVETARTVDPERPIEATLGPVTVLGDHVRLRQAVDNLLANVREHTPAGSPVTVTVAREGDRAVLRVRDTGPGLAAEQADRVFERFYRADPSRARASGGVGLGLSIVAAVAEAHGGSVAAESAPGEGATFTVTLPVAG